MLWAILGVLIFAVIFGPQLWVRHVMTRHGVDRPDLPGTGGELARHLLDRFGLEAVPVEPTDHGDHYDPAARCVRLSNAVLGGRSLTAVAVAAHEVGHALQHAEGQTILAWRTSLARTANVLNKIAAVILLLTPVIGAITRIPGVVILEVGVGLGLMLLTVVVHAVTLPVELDASFRRALPILDRGEYLDRRDLPAARSILRAAALTYVAAALASLLNVARWIRILR